MLATNKLCVPPAKYKTKLKSLSRFLAILGAASLHCIDMIPAPQNFLCQVCFEVIYSSSAPGSLFTSHLISNFHLKGLPRVTDWPGSDTALKQFVSSSVYGVTANDNRATIGLTAHLPGLVKARRYWWHAHNWQMADALGKEMSIEVSHLYSHEKLWR